MQHVVFIFDYLWGQYENKGHTEFDIAKQKHR